MHSIRPDAPKLSRRDFLRGALASAALLALPSCIRGNGGPTIASANDGREVPLFLGANALSQDSLTNMRNDILTLKAVLEKLVDTARTIVRQGGPRYDFSGCNSVARSALELADDFASEARADMDYLTKRWEFVHMQLVYSIRGYRDGFGGMGISARRSVDSLGLGVGVDEL